MPLSVNWEKYREDALKSLREKRVVPLTTEICEESEAIALECLLEANLKGFERVTLLINSGGGATQSGFAISNAVRLSKVRVTGLVLAKAHSSAMVILQGCYERIACHGASMLMHWGKMTFDNFELHAIMQGDGEWVVKQIRERNEAILKLLASRSKLSLEQVREMCFRETYVYANEALAFGLVDRVLGPSEVYSFNGGEKKG